MPVARPSLACIALALGVILGAASGAEISAKFTLVDHDGHSVTERSYADRWLLVFFGYTYCPDVCPTTLVTVASVLATLGSDADHVQALFISVDPRRDSPARLREYLAAFDAPIIGLTGSAGRIEAAAASFRARFRKVEAGAADADGYAIDHSAFLYLMNPRGEFVTAFGFGDPAEHVAAEIRRRLAP